jgi:C-terminal processing protease CtpA/Prc
MFTQLTLAAALVLGAPALKDKETLGKGPGYIGITFQKDEGGLLITEVKPDTPASKVGLKVNDLLVKIEGVNLADADTGDLVKMVGGMRPGTIVVMEIRRGAEMLTVKLKLVPRPADFTPTPVIPPQIIDRD